MRYAALIGARDQLVGPSEAEFTFVDLGTLERWTLRPNAGRLPWWIFSASRRVPGTRPAEYLELLRLFVAGKAAAIADCMTCSGLLYDRLWNPLLLAALNTEPPAASAKLAAAVFRESLALGGAACRPLVAEQGLSRAFVDPALQILAKQGGAFQSGRRLKALRFDNSRVKALDFGDAEIELGVEDRIVLAVPSWVAAGLVPDLVVPMEQRAIINGHFKFDVPADMPAMLGLIGGTVEWIFSFRGRISVTVSGADRLLEMPREALAELFWREIQAATGFVAPLPAWQVIKEKRATFAALPSEEAKRPQPETSWRNLVLAGDYTATGLPATIEGAIRSGFRAADLVKARGRSIH
jgi:squalene-associated FAD-dependent desaturase